LWPAWLARILPDLGDITHTFGLVGADDSWKIEKRPAFSRRAKVVCAACNNGWMSRLEMAAAPLLTPMITGSSSIQLSARNAVTVAAWTIKTAMAIQVGHPARPAQAIPLAHFQSVFRENVPPTTSQIWIGACTHDDRPAYATDAQLGRYRLAPLSRFRPEDVSASQPSLGAYSVTMSLGNLVMQIFGHQYQSAAQLHFSSLEPSALTKIWPPPKLGASVAAPASDRLPDLRCLD
jgi:hypothetical protein